MTNRTVRQRVGAAAEILKLRRRGVPFPALAPAVGRTGVFLGASNSAGQGWLWARALEQAAPERRAVSARFGDETGDNGFGFDVDLVINSHYAAHSARWQRAQTAALKGYGTVLIESGDAVLSRALGGDTGSQIAVLQAAGVQVGLLFHGSDIRDPDRHLSEEQHSHFGVDDEFTALFREVTQRNRTLITTSQRQVFVSTPDLLDEVPGATWLPVVVDPEAWAEKSEPLSHSGPMRVVHIPSSSFVKGTELVDPLLVDLNATGRIDYRPVNGIPHADMPTAYRGADVVIDQFRVGNYGVAACEALAAGRIVVSHVSNRVRERTHELTGDELPIVEATPETLVDVLADISRHPDSYAQFAKAGPEFVRKHHDGRRSGAVLAEWISASG